MKILLTGTFGNVGTSTLKELIKKEHFIRCFDIPTQQNKKKAQKLKKFKNRVEIFWGDLRNYSDVEKAVEGVDVIIHLGAIIPPLANKKPEFAEPINVGGTKNIIKAIKQQKIEPKLIFSSSVAIFGDVRGKDPNYLIKINDPFNPSPHDEYARMKIKCEEMIRTSNIAYAIFRFAAIPPIELKTDPLMFEVPLDTPIEFCHTFDTGLAMANATASADIWGKIFNIGGGPNCRIPYSEYVGRLLDAMGIGRLPKEAFGIRPFHCGYMDTIESEHLLKYQRHTFEDLVSEVKKRLWFVRIFTLLFKPIIRKYLLAKSTYYMDYKKTMKEYIHPKSKFKVVKLRKIKTSSMKKSQTKSSKMG